MVSNKLMSGYYSEGNEIFGIGSHCDAKQKQLPNELEKFVMDPTSNGTIYIAFGTHVNWVIFLICFKYNPFKLKLVMNNKLIVYLSTCA